MNLLYSMGGHICLKHFLRLMVEYQTEGVVAGQKGSECYQSHFNKLRKMSSYQVSCWIWIPDIRGLLFHLESVGPVTLKVPFFNLIPLMKGIIGQFFEVERQAMMPLQCAKHIPHFRGNFSLSLLLGIFPLPLATVLRAH